jgi:hypothetical protein
MPIPIVQHSVELCNFLLPLLVGLNAFQQRHALNVVDALLSGSGKHKVLTAITRMLLVAHADHFALADFLRRSPWDAEAVRRTCLTVMLTLVVRLQRRFGFKQLFLSVDDSLCVKDAATRALETVGFHFDHVRQRRQAGRFSNASRYISISLAIGPFSFPINWRIYLKQSQVKKLNTSRPKAQHLRFRPLHELAKEMLAEIDLAWPGAARAAQSAKPPTDFTIYVLFDAWFGSRDFLLFIRNLNWHFIGASRSNRNLSNRLLSSWWPHLAQQRSRKVTLRSAKTTSTYLTRFRVGRLARIPFEVIVIFSKRNQQDDHPAYFISSDTRLRAPTILKFYAFRWNAEIDNWFLKERLGLADFRVRCFEAIQRWHTLVFIAYAFIAVRRATLALTTKSAIAVKPADVIREHQAEHARAFVAYIASLARSGCSDDAIATIALSP